MLAEHLPVKRLERTKVMILTKSILRTLNDHGEMSGHGLIDIIDHPRTIERLVFLCENGYVKQIGDVFTITVQGVGILHKIMG
jgi:hypothetical protein